MAFDEHHIIVGMCGDGLYSVIVSRLEISPHCLVEGVEEKSAVTTRESLEVEPMCGVSVEGRIVPAVIGIVPFLIQA